MSKAVEIEGYMLRVHTRFYDRVNGVVVCHKGENDKMFFPFKRSQGEMNRKESMTRKEAMNLVRKIQTECDRHRKCNRCPFYHNDVKWCICDGQSIDWDIPKEGEPE